MLCVDHRCLRPSLNESEMKRHWQVDYHKSHDDLPRIRNLCQADDCHEKHVKIDREIY